MVDEDNDAKLPAVVAGRFLPMVEDPAWFSSAEAQAQKVGEEKAPKVELKRGSRLEFDYPSMKDLGQLTCCRIWHDHKKARKRHFLSHLYIKCIVLPRQARDKHRENSKNDRFLAGCLAPHAGGRASQGQQRQ